MYATRGVHYFIRVIGSISGRFKIKSCAYIDFYMIVNSFLNWVKSGSVIRSGEYWIIESVLNTSIRNITLVSDNNGCF